jgi:hypothetical protein
MVPSFAALSTWIWALLAGGFFGILLLAVGLWPRRVGTTRFCRRCGYDLTGQSGARCTECGRDVSLPRAWVVGRRVRRPWVIAAGAALLVATLAPLGLATYVWARGVDWYPYKPTSWMIWDLVHGGSDTVRRAAMELGARLLIGKLSNDEVIRLSDACLDAQLGATFWERSTARMMLLRDLYAAQCLTSQQRERMFEQALRVRSVRLIESLSAEHEFPIMIEYDARVPEGAFFASIQSVKLIIGAEERPLAVPVAACTGWSDARCVVPTTQFDDPGRVNATLRISIAMTATSYAPTEAGTIVYSRTVERPLVLDILDAAHAPRVRLATALSKSNDMLKSIRVHRIPPMPIGRTPERTPPRIALWFDEDLPAHVSASVYALWDQQERFLGKVLQREVRDVPTCVLLAHDDLAAAPGRISVVLRPDSEPAEATADVREIWGDVIQFTDVEYETDRKLIDLALRVGAGEGELTVKSR